MKGVKGASVLVAHKHFNLCTGAVIDVMHCVFLGVISKTLMGFWLDVRHGAAPYSLRRKVNVCHHTMYMYMYFCVLFWTTDQAL